MAVPAIWHSCLAENQPGVMAEMSWKFRSWGKKNSLNWFGVPHLSPALTYL